MTNEKVMSLYKCYDWIMITISTMQYDMLLLCKMQYDIPLPD